MGDKACCICKETLEEVLITRYVGSFTAAMGKAAATHGEGGGGGGLSERAKKGELWHDEYLNAYFDDRDHMKELQYVLCLT